MTAFYDTLRQVIELLEREGRVSYRALRRHFELDDDTLEDLKFELVQVKQLATDQDAQMLVWTGRSLPAPEVAEESPPEYGPSRPEAEGERRQLTVMFCDLVDSTSLASRLDPEDLRDVVRAYQATCAEVIDHFDGYIAQFLGDGLLVYFGYPLAHEDDARRAALAGLEIIRQLGSLNERLEREAGVRLATRVGIHTGAVVVGDVRGGCDKMLALGATPNLAARLECLAKPDSIVISAATHRLVQSTLQCEDLGEHRLKGIDAPIGLYRVAEPGQGFTDGAQVPATRPAPLVGRDDELRLLLGRWRQVEEGEGQVVVLCGEPGIGKSRLVSELESRLTERGHYTITHRCSPYHTNTALYPVIEHLERWLGFDRGDGEDTKLEKIERALAEYSRNLDEGVPLFAALLSVPLPEGRYPPLNLSPQRLKQRTQEELMQWLLDEASARPLLVIFEDVHWADPSTRDLLALLFDQVPTARLMVMLTFRPQFRPPWRKLVHFTQLTLSGLGRKQAAAIIERVTGGRSLPDAVVDAILAKTDGVPLFVEELTKMVLESGILAERAGRYVLKGELTSLDIPVTLQDSLMARLDRLREAKEVAQLGATLGREFSYELIRAVSPLDEGALRESLRRLVASELIVQKGLPPASIYGFKHALIQDAACQSLLRRKRQAYHQSIVSVLLERFQEVGEAHPELLAYHCTEAGLTEQAILHWGRAGEKAMRRSASVEAVSHLSKGLELLKGLPNTQQRDQAELQLRVALGAALIAIKGYGAVEVEQSYARARQLCAGLTEAPELAPVLVGLEAFYLLRGELEMARDLARQLLLLAEGRKERDARTMAHAGMGVALFYLGDFDRAITHLDQGIQLYDPKHHPTLTFQDAGVACLSWSAVALWIRGYPDQALQRSREAVALAEKLAEPFNLAFALTWAARVHQARHEPDAVAQRAAEAIALSLEQGYPFYAAQGTLLRGWAMTQQGQASDGIAEMRRGLKAWHATGSELAGTYFLALLADAYGKAGHPAKGMLALKRAHQQVKRTQERWWESELYRLEAELLSLQGAARESVERCLQQALGVARARQARSLELRAAISLARLQANPEPHCDPCQELREVIGGFEEGRDTRDLVEARQLLGYLRPTPRKGKN